MSFSERGAAESGEDSVTSPPSCDGVTILSGLIASNFVPASVHRCTADSVQVCRPVKAPNQFVKEPNQFARRLVPELGYPATHHTSQLTRAMSSRYQTRLRHLPAILIGTYHQFDRLRFFQTVLDNFCYWTF